MTSSPSPRTELQLSLLVQGGSLRSPRAARPPAGPALLSPPRSSPADARAALKVCSRLMSENGYVADRAVGSMALRNHSDASLEDHGPNLVSTGQVHRLPDALQANEAMLTGAKAVPDLSRPTDVQITQYRAYRHRVRQTLYFS